jgi:hypothetical protein
MRLKKARVTKYRSIRDSGWFDIEEGKTILVGPNEAGKTAILQALQRVNAPKGTRPFDPLRDYPRSEYNDLTTKKIKPEDVTVVEAHFVLEAADTDAIPAEFKDVMYCFGRKLDETFWHKLEGGPPRTTYGSIKKDLGRLVAHVDAQADPPAEGSPATPAPSVRLAVVTEGWDDADEVGGDRSKKLKAWLEAILPLVDEANETEGKRYDKLIAAAGLAALRELVLKTLHQRLPIFVLFSNYFRVRPLIHLEHLAQRLETGVLDDDAYDYGNKCLLQLLGFSARELSKLGKAAEPPIGNVAALQNYRDQLDRRSYQLNAASVRLTEEIRAVWYPDPKRAEAERLRVVADQQYLAKYI